MKFLFDIFPVILFFVAYKLTDIFIATGVAIAATFAQIAVVWARKRAVDNMLWVSLAIIVVFGGATLLFRDELFIKWKPTVLYWLFAGVLLVSQAAFRKNLIRAMMSAQVSLPEPVWVRLNTSWIGFFVVMGVLNLIVAFQFSTDTWVNFKLFGSTGLMLLFVLGQAFVLAKYVDDEETKESR